ncbi:MAG: ThiF family adenylyltransferase [Planctomycetota bacterium]
MGHSLTMNNPESKPRYIRQSLFEGIGEAGQQQIGRSKVLVVGCGALGSVIANTLARAGVGHLRIVDRDFLELNNLQRQVLYDEADVDSELPKAIAAANRLRRINSAITIEPIVENVGWDNIAELANQVDVIADWTDNFETRFLINDAAHQLGIPWIYGGCIGAEGQTMSIVPGETGCLRCLMSDVPPPGTTPTCDTAGIVGPIVNIIASFQAAEVLKIVSGNRDKLSPHLSVFDLWGNRVRQIGLNQLRGDRCPTCREENYEWLSGERASQTAVLCGRNAVQLSFPDKVQLDLESLEAKLAEVGDVRRNPFLLRVKIESYELTIFKDGRAVIAGTDDPNEARSVYARYIGA